MSILSELFHKNEIFRSVTKDREYVKLPNINVDNSKLKRALDLIAFLEDFENIEDMLPYVSVKKDSQKNDILLLKHDKSLIGIHLTTLKEVPAEMLAKMI